MDDKVRIFQANDIFSLLIHMGVSLTVCTTAVLSGLISLPFLIGGGISMMALTNIIQKNGGKILEKNSDKATPQALRNTHGNPRLPKIIDYIAKKFDLKTAPELNILSNKNDAQSNPFSSISKQANAFLLADLGSHAHCTITQPALEALSDKEEIGVIAHEVSHFAGKHTLLRPIVRLPASLPTFTTNLKYIGSYFSNGVSGGMVLASYFAAQACYSYAAAKFTGDNSLDSANYKAGKFLVSAVVMGSVPVVLGVPQIAGLWLLTQAGSLITKAITASYSRHNEFHADRLAGEVTRNPLYLSSALSTLEKFGQTKQEVASNKSILQTLSDRTFNSHPPTKKRQKRLLKQHNNFQKTTQPS